MKLRDLQDAIRSILKEEDMSFLDKVGHWIDTSEWGDEERDPRSMRHPKLNMVVDAINDAIDEVPHKEMKSFLWGLNHDFANGIQIESKEKNMNEFRVLREAIKEYLTESIDSDSFREQIEYGDWPGRPADFEWDYVESESSQDVRFDWSGGSMWFRADQGYYLKGEVEGQIPRHLLKHLKTMDIEIYPG